MYNLNRSQRNNTRWGKKANIIQSHNILPNAYNVTEKTKLQRWKTDQWVRGYRRGENEVAVTI